MHTHRENGMASAAAAVEAGGGVLPQSGGSLVHVQGLCARLAFYLSMVGLQGQGCVVESKIGARTRSQDHR